LSYAFDDSVKSGNAPGTLDRRISHAITRPLPEAGSPKQPFNLGASAQIAQLVEHATENRSVAGSIPALGTSFLLKIKKVAR
jgi:hypothetical protein